VNKIEALKTERDGLDVTEDLVRFAPRLSQSAGPSIDRHRYQLATVA
jgi:hypothetical protein